MSIITQKQILVLLALAFVSPSLLAEDCRSIYALAPTVDGLLVTASVGLCAVSLLVDDQKTEQVARDEINLFDRLAVRPYDELLDQVGTAGSYTALILPAVSALGALGDMKTIGTYAAMYAETFLLTMATKNTLKSTISRWRPYTYEGPPADEYDESFPSGHTAYAFMGATFLAETFSHDHPESRWKLPLIGAAYAIATTTATLRVLAGEHFITDVLAGAAIGSFYGWGVPFVHRLKERDRAVALTVSPHPIGVSVLFKLP